jgi:lipopolysaccharide transport system ATP-binding protein
VDDAISIRDLSKSYRVVPPGFAYNTLVDAMAGRIRHPLRRTRKETFWALRDVDMRVGVGEAVGIVGRNGAGKSTLLKILSRIVEPTTGEARMRGRVGSLLEVGTGFHPELTGRENIYLNGSILGMRRREIEARFDEIVEFSGVEAFLEVPVKRYSSGMIVRLAFAVAAHLEPEILIIDEVLAVGDAEFQRKCLGKMNEVATVDARTVLFVSHNMAAVENLCTRCIVLEKGRVIFEGPTHDAVSVYLSRLSSSASELGPGAFDLSDRPRPTDGAPRLVSVRVESEGVATSSIRMGADLTVIVEVEGLDRSPETHLGITMYSDRDQALFSLNTRLRAARGDERCGRDEFVCRIPAIPIVPGNYSLSLGLEDRILRRLHDSYERAALIEIVPSDLFGSHVPTADYGLAFVDFDWEVHPSVGAEQLTTADER